MQPVSTPSSPRNPQRVIRRFMQDFVNLVMLVCASLASMGLGVFAAYAIFKGVFALMQRHSRLAAPAASKPSTEIASASSL